MKLSAENPPLPPNMAAIRAVAGGQNPDYVVNREVLDDPVFRAKFAG